MSHYSQTRNSAGSLSKPDQRVLLLRETEVFIRKLQMKFHYIPGVVRGRLETSLRSKSVKFKMR